MLNFLTWLVFGALAGWLASILTGKSRKINGVANIVFGILGAFVGAGILNTLGYPVPMGLSVMGFLVAVGGAVVLILAMSLVRK